MCFSKFFFCLQFSSYWGYVLFREEVKSIEKLSYFAGVCSVPSTWQPCHVMEIITYLKSRGYNYELYKEINSSKFILVNKNAVLFYKKASELCDALKDLYFDEKKSEEVELIKARNDKARKNNLLLGGLYEKNY